GILLPVRPGGQDHGAGFVDIPLAVVALGRRNPAIMSAPAMPDHFQTETRGAIQIGFKGQSFFLLMPAADQPLNGKSARPELHGYAGVIKPAVGKMKTGLQAGRSHPIRFEDASLADACGLDPAQDGGALFSVVMRKHEVPQPQNGDRSDHVNQQNAPHNASSDAHGTSEVAGEARGQSHPFGALLATCSPYLWKTWDRSSHKAE